MSTTQPPTSKTGKTGIDVERAEEIYNVAQLRHFEIYPHRNRRDSVMDELRSLGVQFDPLDGLAVQITRAEETNGTTGDWVITQHGEGVANGTWAFKPQGTRGTWAFKPQCARPPQDWDGSHVTVGHEAEPTFAVMAALPITGKVFIAGEYHQVFHFTERITRVAKAHNADDGGNWWISDPISNEVFAQGTWSTPPEDSKQPPPIPVDDVRDLLVECQKWVFVTRNDYGRHFGPDCPGVTTATELLAKIDAAVKVTE